MGPTGSGKSALALRIAQARPTVIINADAMQMVRELRVLTARPSVEEEAKAEHALYGVLAANEPTSVARWIALVTPVIEQAWKENKLPLLVGGTGMYVKALQEGLSSIPPIPEEIREQVRTQDAASLYAQLQEKDPRMASRLKAGDTQRLARALEVVEATGISLAQWQDAKTTPVFPDAQFTYYVTDLSREAVYRNIDYRFTQMMEKGALDEVRALMALNLLADTPILKAHGAPELMAQLRGEMTLEAAIAKGQQNTRNYAKRQMTWNRHQLSGAIKLAPDGPLPAKIVKKT